MSFIDAVRAKRQKLADVMSDPEYSGIREIVEELYPDKAHFIYELLQNAEDADASEARFELRDDGLSFEHNGRAFSESDVEGITNIGKGTKRDQEEKIGRFGVGFKAVFAYSETPRVFSPTFSFEITQLVLPTELPGASGLAQKTRFEFPFNNPVKPAEDAFDEVKHGLEELAETTLLFLSHLTTISWVIDSSPPREVCRVNHSGDHIEVLKRIGGKTTSSSHFLRFKEPVEELPKQYVALAFELDLLPKTTRFDPKNPLSQQFKIMPADPGRVAVFFPAEKETSGLRFHLHAPFVPELSRASIKETDVNAPLFEQLAKLSKSCLFHIRDQGLLSSDFLGVLPNPDDPIPERYSAIRDAIIEVMKENPLTPTHSQGFAPAQVLRQAKASLKNLLTGDDIKFLIDYKEDPPQWAIGASLKNSNADRFLSGLDISDWGIEEFVEKLEEAATVSSWQSPDEEFMQWLAAKTADWHQQFYALLYKDLSPDDELGRLEELNIVRLQSGDYSTGRECFFPGNQTEHDEVLPRVDPEILLEGKRKGLQRDAHKFLEEIGVREVGETEQVKVLLEKRYSYDADAPSWDVYTKDLKRFVELFEQAPDTASMFGDFYIFARTNGMWAKPRQTFLDSPYFETGLSAYYQALGEGAAVFGLSEDYQNIGIEIKRIVKFAKAAGVLARLETKMIDCYSNPQWEYLRSVAGERRSSPINRDFTIPGLESLLAKPSIGLAKLVWQTMCTLPIYPNRLQACYRKNESSGARYADSQLVCTLREIAWVPQGDGVFVVPSRADSNLLPKGFSYDSGYDWLKKVRFGAEKEIEAEKAEENERTAKKLGFSDVPTLFRAREFAALPAGEQERLLGEAHAARDAAETPENEPQNPERRSERVREQAADAPERTTEKRERSVSVGREDVKQEAAEYLRTQYTTSDSKMFCQICRAPLPFKLDDGNYYFERVEFLRDLRRRHYQNYLALCPNHAAMFQYANGDFMELRLRLKNIEGNELEVELARKPRMVFFTKTHIGDLRAVVESEEEAVSDGED
jgi:hypothetical protein